MRLLRQSTPLLTLAVAALAACGDDISTAPVPDPALAPADAVALCHRNDRTADFELLMVTPNGKAVEKHLDHGDAMPGDPIPGGYTLFPSDCTLPYIAIAYTDRDPSDGDGYKAGVDRLISMLLDTDGNTRASVGDEVYLFGYPLDFDASAFGSFKRPSHEVSAHPRGPACQARVTTGAHEDRGFIWGGSEAGHFFTQFGENIQPFGIRDNLVRDEILVGSGRGAVGSPEVAVDLERESDRLDGFIVVDVLCTV